MIGVDLVAGRNFSADIRSDFESAYILNETAVEKLGLENPVGKPFKLLDNEGWIIGVVEDFHTRRLTERLRANAFVLRPRSFRVVNLRLATGNVGETMQGLEEIWKTFIPVRPIMYAFLDYRLEVNYGKYLRFQRIFAVGFGVSFLIASIGLLGLAAYTSERRRKEFGIRKVFGASIGEIAVLLGAEFQNWCLSPISSLGRLPISSCRNGCRISPIEQTWAFSPLFSLHWDLFSPRYWLLDSSALEPPAPIP